MGRVERGVDAHPSLLRAHDLDQPARCQSIARVPPRKREHFLKGLALDPALVARTEGSFTPLSLSRERQSDRW